MPTGKVKWFDPNKGYGFIEPDDGSDDVFVHHSEVQGTDPRDGQTVEFDVREGPRGLKAVDVQTPDQSF